MWIPEFLAQPIGGAFTVALVVWEAGIALLLLSLPARTIGAVRPAPHPPSISVTAG